MRTRLLVFFLLLGGSFLGAAFFAEFIGLDNDPGWGRGRVVLLLIGILIAVLGVTQYFFTNKVMQHVDNVQTWLSRAAMALLQFTRRYWYTFPFALIVILVYIWFASSGSWNRWDSATRYYADLANGFEHRQLHLVTRPNSELLSLSNPYDPELRRGIEFPIDYALYNEKFYIYWGPVPALILVLINPFISERVGDLFLAFGFTSGIFVLQYLFLLFIWDRFFNDSPKWMLLTSIVVSGLSGPWMYMLVNEPNGRIYEAAITGAQFFLLAGLLIIVIALAKFNRPYFSLALASLLWGLSIGTRLVIAVPVGLICLMIAYHLWKKRFLDKSIVANLMALALPLGICVVALGWYNWARFGSVTDTGFAYSLAHQDMLKYHDQLFSPLYIFQNIYNYLFNAPSPMTGFPFLYSDRGAENMLPLLFSLPDVYESQPITGLFYTAPITLFAIIPVIAFFNRSARKSTGDYDLNLLNFINLTLLAAFFSAFCFLLIFFWAALRYMGDFLPELMLAGILGFWRGHQLLIARPATRKLYSLVAGILAVTGIFISILISLSANQYSFHGFDGFM